MVTVGERDLAKLMNERDELRAQVEQHERRFREVEAEWVGRFEVLEAEAERLRVSSTRPDAGAWVHRQAELQAEVERLRAVVDAVQQMIDLGEIDKYQPESYALVEALAALARPKKY